MLATGALSVVTLYMLYITVLNRSAVDPSYVVTDPPIAPTSANPIASSKETTSASRPETKKPVGLHGLDIEQPTTASSPSVNVKPQPQCAARNSEWQPDPIYIPGVSKGVSQSCQAKLYTPTYVEYMFNKWIIVDCWHHRVLFSDHLDAPVSEWRDLDAGHVHKHEAMRIPHTVASDGELLLVESSVGGSSGGNHSVLVYVPDCTGTGFEFVEEVIACRSDVRRPHRLSYDPLTKAFYLYLTNPPSLAKFVRSGKSIKLEWCDELHFMRGVYARSFALHQGFMYITAGPHVMKVDYKADDGKPKLVKTIDRKNFGVKNGGMNDLQFIQGWWYVTSTIPCTVGRFRDIDRPRVESIARELGMCGAIDRKRKHCHTGTPYFMTAIGDTLYLPYIFGCSGVVTFKVSNDTGKIKDVSTLFGDGWVEQDDDIQCRGKKW